MSLEHPSILFDMVMSHNPTCVVMNHDSVAFYYTSPRLGSSAPVMLTLLAFLGWIGQEELYNTVPKEMVLRFYVRKEVSMLTLLQQMQDNVRADRVNATAAH